MNLFVETIKQYLIKEWDRVLADSEGTKEARFIVESLDPKSTFELFSALEEHRLKTIQHKNVECHFRVAKNLWNAWCQREDESELKQIMQEHNAIDSTGELKWIDLHDQLTWYRNCSLPDSKDGLIVVLLGFNHATDQGGLTDFHLVDENRIWQEIEKGFVIWVECINKRFSLEASSIEIDHFNDLLTQLFKVRPRQLVKLAEFLEQKIFSQSTFYTLTEVIDLCYKELPYWDIPPLSFDKKDKKSDVLIDADTFIRHQRFITPSEQKKAWKKIEDFFQEEGNDELPETIVASNFYSGVQEYTDTLHAFIFKADSNAKAKLMQTDARLILDILKKKTSAGPSKSTVKRLKGLSSEVMLQAIWIGFLEIEKTYSGRPVADFISKIQITVVRFNHDIQADNEQGVDGHSLAEELLTGCLGGLDTLFSEINLRMPVDTEQSCLAYDCWEKEIPIDIDLTGVKYGTSRQQPHITFSVSIKSDDSSVNVKPVAFRWRFDANHPERVRFECARNVLQLWPLVSDHEMLLPTFKLPGLVMTALYFSADEEEANRLLNQALTELKVANLTSEIELQDIDVSIRHEMKNLSGSYHSWLHSLVSHGYFVAMQQHYLNLQTAYQTFSKKVLDRNLVGSAELLKCLYKAFLLVDEKVEAKDAYLRSALICGISPPVIELTHARDCFLRNSFPEIIAQHLRIGNGTVALDRLLNLVEIHRPLAALVTDIQGNLSAEIKSFGLLHYLGTPPTTEKSLAVQTLLREDDSDDDGDITDITRSTEESKIVERVLKDYLQLYPFAQDGIRILAVNVEDLANILSGVDRFLKAYLKSSSADWPSFHCEVMIYSKSSSPLSVESQLAKWRNHVMEAYREQGRSVVLSVAHHFAPTQDKKAKDKMIKVLKQEPRIYDIAFIFNFLAGELAGEVEPTLPFKFDFNVNNISQFPVCEYPRPIQKADSLIRRSLLSNRRLRIQTHHADLTARLRHPQNPDSEHLIFGHVEYQSWQTIVESLHSVAQWVACIDPFVDKRLLASSEHNGQRKIVGFTSGLGAYGELNLSISTEQDTLTQLTDMVNNHLSSLLSVQLGYDFEIMAAKVVKEAEEVIGLSSLRAVVGQGEKIREVVGFSAVRRALSVPPDSLMMQLLPVDSLLHWFIDSEITHRPDLLQLSLVLRENDIPLIHAVLVECKFAQQNNEHITKAFDQIHDGLSHLTELFTPNRTDARRVSFDRRYWWAQLQRAITTRSVVSMPEQERKKLDVALEQLVEGYYEIQWQGVIFTFWTDSASHDVGVTKHSLPKGLVNLPLQVPGDFFVNHVEMGYERIINLFSSDSVAEHKIDLQSNPILCRPELGDECSKPEIDATDDQENDSSNGYEHISNDLSDDSFSHEINIDNDVPIVDDENLIISDDLIVDVDDSKTTLHEEAEVTSSNLLVPNFSPAAEKLLIGTRSNGDPVYWHYGHMQLKNRHMLLFGTSGSGKTYGIQCLLAEMAKERMRSIIIDYTDGFLPQQVEEQFLEVVKPKNHFVVHDRLPVNPFRRQQKIIDPSIPAIQESSFQVASRITSIFTSVFSSMGDQQSSALTRALEKGIEENEQFSFNDLLPLLRDDSQNGESLANKIEPFIKSEPFRQGSDSAWEEMLTAKSNWVQTLQLSGLSRDIQKLVTEFALWDLYDFACNTGSKNRPIPIVLDEIQNLDHRSDSPIDKMLREGRKFGLSLMLATQTTSNFNQEQRDRLFQAGHKLFFKPADTEIKKFAEVLSDVTGDSKHVWAERLAKLEKGQCWSLGPVMTSTGGLQDKAILVSITALEKRFSKV